LDVKKTRKLGSLNY